MDVSAVITTYSRPEKLKRAIKSVARQTSPPEELIIVDDSERQSLAEDDVVEILPSTVDLHYIHTADPQGVSTARNRGIERASMEYVAFLDDDDEWLPTKLERQKETLSQSSAKVCYTWLKRVHDDRGIVLGRVQPECRGNVRNESLDGCISVVQTYLVERQLLETLGGFDEELSVWEDWDFCIRLAKHAQFTSVSEPLTICHVDTGESLSDEIEARFELFEYLCEKHLPFGPAYSNDADTRFKSSLLGGIWYSSVLDANPRLALRAWSRSVSIEKSPLISRFLLAVFSPFFVPVARQWRYWRASSYDSSKSGRLDVSM